MLLTRPVKLWAVWLLELARRLRGKHKRNTLPHVDTGDYIIVLNAEKLLLPATSAKTKCTTTTGPHRWYPSDAEEMIARRPERVIEIAVKGMLPKGPLGRAMYRKLKVYAGS
ncbi:50S ribosomal protein L13 [Klebsiella pneumoniae]|nr:50S ribosomal protein L13 [Klebsiella pneumoniae]